MSLKKEMIKKNSQKIIGTFVTITILLLLFLIGPAKAITLGITNVSNENPNEGDIISFLAKIDIHTNDVVPLTNFTIEIKSLDESLEYNCTFDLMGNNLTTCPSLSASLVSGNYNYSSSGGHAYGYGFNDSGEFWGLINESFSYGYSFFHGYGYNSFNENIPNNAEFVYNITWKTPLVSEDTIFKIHLYAQADDGSNDATFRTKAPESITVKNVPPPTGGGGSSSTTTQENQTGVDQNQTPQIERPALRILGSLTREGTNLRMSHNENASFIFKDKEHNINVKEISSERITLIIRSDPIEVTIQKGTKESIDLDRNGIDDIAITFRGLFDNGEADLFLEELYFDSLTESPCPEGFVLKDGECVKVDKDSPLFLVIVTILIFLIIVVLILLGSIFNYKKGERKRIISQQVR